MLLILIPCLLVNFMSTVSAQSCDIGDLKFKDFDMTKYVGKWNELYRIPNKYEQYYKCEFDEYTLTPEGVINVTSRAYNTSTSSYETSTGEVPTWSSNNFTIKYNNDELWTQTYWVLGTDYETYSVVSGCLEGEDRLLTWVASRKSSFDEDVVKEVQNVLKQYDMTLDKLESVDQSNCPAYTDIST